VNSTLRWFRSIDALALDGMCIASAGAVETVALHHRVPLADVHTLALDEASRTSAALAKILIAKASGRAPQTTSIAASQANDADSDAILVIGDPAFQVSRDGYEKLDLGAAWDAAHRLPFVFAVMLSTEDAARSGVGQLLSQGLARGRASASTIARSYNSGVEPARAERYLREVIRYDLGAREKEGLRLFYRLAQEHGLLSDVEELRFHAI
jgi:chorismate dehydratase